MTKNLNENLCKNFKIQRQAGVTIPTPWGSFELIAFSNNPNDQMPHLALVHQGFQVGTPTVVRIHSECITGDLFASKRCDCGEQLHRAMETTAQRKGVLLYLRQEGRGIGIINKIKAYNLQDAGMNTVDANLHLGLEADARQYDIAIQMLQSLGINQLLLMTNNPLKINAFDNSPIKVVGRIPIVIPPKKENYDYLKTKQLEMGHLFDML